MKKLRIGLDFDDVLIESADYTVKLYNETYGTHLTRDDWYDDPSIVEPWKVDDFSKVVSRVVELQSTEAFMNVNPVKDAQEVLEQLKSVGHELLVITGRPEQLKDSTQMLLSKYYQDSIDPNNLYFTNHFAHEGERIHKGDIAVELGLTHFVDDVVQHANNVASKDVTTILFGENYKWNQAEPDHGVIRIGTWKALGEFFKKQSNA